MRCLLILALLLGALSCVEGLSNGRSIRPRQIKKLRKAQSSRLQRSKEEDKESSYTVYLQALDVIAGLSIEEQEHMCTMVQTLTDEIDPGHNNERWRNRFGVVMGLVQFIICK